MTDDTVTSGRQVPGRVEAIATLFYACYPQLVATGYGVAGDWAVAEELAQEACHDGIACRRGGHRPGCGLTGT